MGQPANARAAIRYRATTFFLLRPKQGALYSAPSHAYYCILHYCARDHSRGNPTVEIDVTLADGSLDRAAVPSDAFTVTTASKPEAFVCSTPRPPTVPSETRNCEKAQLTASTTWAALRSRYKTGITKVKFGTITEEGRSALAKTASLFRLSES